MWLSSTTSISLVNLQIIFHASSVSPFILSKAKQVASIKFYKLPSVTLYLYKAAIQLQQLAEFNQYITWHIDATIQAIICTVNSFLEFNIIVIELTMGSDCVDAWNESIHHFDCI